MTQQFHYYTYTLRKPKFKQTHVSQCSLQHYLQQWKHYIWKQRGCASTDAWLKKMWYIYTMEYYSAIKRNTFQSVLMRWMNLEPIIQSEVSQKGKDKYHILTHIYGIQKNGTEEFIYGAAMEKQTQGTDMDMGRREERARCMEGVMWKLAFSSVQFSRSVVSDSL